ncbi:YcxB family protein [Alicyclobacillus sp. SO9]|uniref:YcxB family protein n=1 Tax=Alicyclobacillus sp. SO9 TaxID=2665646 RepID=UPI0018E75EC1|nr:YcxB family protein [Alicyclobacillus sp. SO9]QQE78703.1 YcxB family protein [Alicyclobacillus sp. SO9]
MKIDVLLSERDVKDYVSLKMKSNQKSRAKRVTLLVLFFIIVSLIFWLESRSIFLVVVFDVIVGLFIRFAWNRFLKKAYGRSNLKEPRTIEIQSEFILVTTNNVKTSIELSKVRDVNETDKFLIIVVGNSQELVIPKRAFSTQDEYTEFVNALPKPHD